MKKIGSFVVDDITISRGVDKINKYLKKHSISTTNIIDINWQRIKSGTFVFVVFYKTEG